MLHPHTPASMAPMDTGKPLDNNLDTGKPATLISPIFACSSNGATGGGGAGGWTAPQANVSIVHHF